jgi:hypothetical protein
MRKLLAALAVAAASLPIALPAGAAPPRPTVDGSDDRVTRRPYVRHDGGTDATIDLCNDPDPTVFGRRVQNNEPFSLVSPGDPDLVISGWNDYCSDWMGLGFSTDGGEHWTDSLVPGYPADDSAEGLDSPLKGRNVDTASDPLGTFDTHGNFYFGAISFNGAGIKTNGDVWVARYSVVDPASNGGYPLDYHDTTIVGRGTPSRNFSGRFNDKPMIEVDRTGGPHDGNVYACWSRFTGFGQNKIYFARSTDGGVTFSKPFSISGNHSVQGCDIAVEADGDVYVLWRLIDDNSATTTSGINFVRSSDGGRSFARRGRVDTFELYTPFDTARDCGDGVDACPSGFVFARIPLEPRITSDPTGRLPGVFAAYNAIDPDTVEPSDTSYRSAGPGLVGQSLVYIARSLDDGRTWTPVAVDPGADNGHQFFPDADAYSGQLAVSWQDSRTDPAFDVQLPIGNTPGATSSGTDVVRAFVATSTDGATFSDPEGASSVGMQPQYEMFDDRSVPFIGDYNWVSVVDGPGGSLFGYTTWTDNRDVVPGADPREAVQDGFDVLQCRNPSNAPDTCPNSGGLDQNIYGTSFTIP